MLVLKPHSFSTQLVLWQKMKKQTNMIYGINILFPSRVNTTEGWKVHIHVQCSVLSVPRSCCCGPASSQCSLPTSGYGRRDSWSSRSPAGTATLRCCPSPHDPEEQITLKLFFSKNGCKVPHCTTWLILTGFTCCFQSDQTEINTFTQLHYCIN